MIDADKIRQLTRKLKEQNDISPKEADQIFSLFSANSLKTKLNPNSSKADHDLMDALTCWYKIVAQKIKQGYRGNFIYTIVMPDKLPPSYGGFHYFIRNAQENAEENLKQYGTFEDFFIRLLVDHKIYSSLLPEFQKLFTEMTFCSQSKGFYILTCPRAGMYHYPIKTKTGTYTIAQFIEGFSPIMKIHHYSRGNSFFEVASGSYKLTPNSQLFKATLSGSIIAQYVVAAYMEHKKISCIVMIGHSPADSPYSFDESVVVFTEKDKVRIMKDVLKIPFEDIVKNALHENIISKKMAKDLLDDNLVNDLPVDFIEASVKYIDNALQRQKEWKTTREDVETEAEWLEEIR